MQKLVPVTKSFTETVATHNETPYSNFVTLEEIRIQNIQGVNAELLRKATEAGLRAIDLAPRQVFQGATTGDSVQVVTAPKTSGQLIYTHRIVATIETGAKRISISVNTSAQAVSGGGEVKVNPDVPKRIYDQLVEALKEGTANNAMD